MNRFCAEIDFGKGYIIRGCGPTMEEAKRKLIDGIRNTSFIFPPEKDKLIKEITQPVSSHLSG